MTFLVIVRSGVDGSPALKEALDVAMVAAAFGQTVSLLFEGDGVYHCLPSQNPTVIGVKSYHKALAALPMYEVDNIYICSKSAVDRGVDWTLNKELLIKALSTEAIKTLMSSSKAVLSY